MDEQRRTTDIVIVGEFIVKPGWDTGPRCFTYYSLIYFLSGSRSVYIEEGKRHILSSPCCILTPPGVEHRFEFDPEQPNRHVVIHFFLDSSYEPLVAAARPESHPVVPAESGAQLSSYMRHVVYLAHSEASRWQNRCNLLIPVILEELAALCVKEKESKTFDTLPPQILRVLSHLELHFAEDIQMAELAVTAGWSHEHLTRMFVKHTGMSLQRALQEIRINKACRLLAQELLTVKQITYFTGFQSESHFCRVFKKIRGLTPSEYRKTYSDPTASHLAIGSELPFPYPLNKRVQFDRTPAS